VIDVASGDKTTIGSAFRIDSDLVATNFHVVNLFVHEPSKYRLELVGDDGVGAAVSLVGVDVLHDLAVVRDPQPSARHFELLSTSLAQGERVYSMGNPHDLGMTIIDGNYNGVLKSVRFERLLFSGSLNPGMSGGPAFNQRGEVIGVNVATGGEQLSFLVPVKHLKALLKKARREDKPADFKVAIGQTLLREADEFYTARAADTWHTQRFGDLQVPRDLSPAMKCWGDNVDDDDRAYEAFHQHCRSEEYLFLADDFYTGNFAYDYEWMRTTKLNPLQFYTAVEKRFTHRAQDNTDDKANVTNHRCKTDFVALAGAPWKVSMCLRRYKDYEGLHDASLVMVSLRANDRAAVIKMSATGIGKQRALAIFEKLGRRVRWVLWPFGSGRAPRARRKLRKAMASRSVSGVRSATISSWLIPLSHLTN
jgi:serine protease Do